LIIQVKVPVEADDDADSLAARVLTQEHIIYPTAIRWFAEGRLRMEGTEVIKDGSLLETPISMHYGEAPPS
jgi:phosphoribosylglycinamide formyltransferase-1